MCGAKLPLKAASPLPERSLTRHQIPERSRISDRRLRARWEFSSMLRSSMQIALLSLIACRLVTCPADTLQAHIERWNGRCAVADRRRLGENHGDSKGTGKREGVDPVRIPAAADHTLHDRWCWERARSILSRLRAVTAAKLWKPATMGRIIA